MAGGTEPTDDEPATETIARGKADLGFILALEGTGPPGSALIWRERLGLHAGRDHPLARRRRVSPAEAIHPPFHLSAEEVSAARCNRGSPREVRHRGDSYSAANRQRGTARRTMMQGKAIGTLFASTAKVDVDQGDLVELPLSKEALTVEVRLVASQYCSAGRAGSHRACRPQPRGQLRPGLGASALQRDLHDCDAADLGDLAGQASPSSSASAAVCRRANTSRHRPAGRAVELLHEQRRSSAIRARVSP